MTYKSPDYYQLDRNHTRHETMLSLIDLARDLNRLKYVDRITLTGIGRDSERIETSIAAAAKTAMLDAAIDSLVKSAQEIQDQTWEPVDLKKATGI